MNEKTRKIEIWASTANYLDILCCQYNLCPDTIVRRGLELAELNLAEIEARKSANQRDEQ